MAIEAQGLRRGIVLYSAVAIAVISLMVAAASIVPLAFRLREAAHAALRHAAELKVMAAEEFLTRASSLAQQVTSRSVIRDKLAEYDHGRISLETVADFTRDKLVDALNLSPELRGIVRLGARGDLVVAVGEPFPWQAEAIPGPPARQPALSPPMTIDGQPYLVAAAPIVDRNGERLGTDLVLIDARRLLGIVRDTRSLGRTGDIAVLSPDDPPRVLIPFSAPGPTAVAGRVARIFSRAVIGESGPVVDADGDPLIVAAVIPSSRWIMLMAVDTHEATASVDRLVLGVALASTMLGVAGVLGMLVVLRPLTGAIILHADDLRRQYEEKMKALSSLTGGIAHEINNMLLPILSLVGLTIKELPPDARSRARLERVIEAAQRARSLVAQMMIFARCQEEAKAERVDVAASVAVALNAVQPSLPATIKVDISLVPDAGAVMADPADVETVVANLISNAVDAMEGRPGRLRIALERVEADSALVGRVPELRTGPYVRLTVSDSGKGMDEATLSRAFDPFFTTKEVGTGTGLGLAVVHGIVTSRGGAVAMTSEPGVGTSAEVYLPAVD